MSKYFNTYSHGSDPQYNAIVDQSDSSITPVVGNLGSDGLLSLLSAAGTPLYSKTYTVDGETVNFHKAVETANGDYVIFGSKIKDGADALILRVRPNGNIDWSNSIRQTGASEFVDLIRVDTDDYVSLTKITIDGVHTFELLKFAGDGTIQNDFQATIGEYSFVPMGLEVSTSGFLVYGGTDINGDWDALYVLFDVDFKVLSSERVGNSRYQFTRAALHIGDDKFVVSGEYDTTKNSYIHEYKGGLSSFSPGIINICDNVSDEGIKRLRLLDSTTDDYLLMAQNDSSSDAYFCVFNSSYALQKRTKVTRPAKYLMTDLIVHDGAADGVRVSGLYGNTQNEALAVSTNDQLSLCCISNVSLPTTSSNTFSVSSISLGGKSNGRAESAITMTVASEVLSKTKECPSTAIDTSGTWMSQSPFLFLQAAGSDGVDETVKGFHLRWDLKGVLGEKHMPKGNLSGPYGAYPATHTFNKSDDYVKVYRSAFVNDYFTKLNLEAQPSSYNVGGQVREWNYNNLSPLTVVNSTTMNVVVSFPNTSAYDAQAASTPPSSSTGNFLKNYSGEINIRLVGKLAFRVGWTFGYLNSGNLSNAVCRHEFIGLKDSTDNTSQELRFRETFTQPDFASAPHSICEDIYMVRLDRVNAYPSQLEFYCYEDYIQGTNENEAWTELDEFSLTEDQSLSFKRLEDNTVFGLHNRWPKFNEDNSTTGEFKVNVSNYQDRWNRTNGLAAGVNKYLTLSQVSTNTSAVESVPVTPKGQMMNNHEQAISYFNLLGIATLDYHVSRMLGFGMIDANEDLHESDKFVYLAEYDTEGDLEDGQGARNVKHIYMTPHQTIMDFKHPPVPELQDPITYGLAFNNGTANPSQITNANGYTPFADIRFVNLNREPFQFEQPLQSFFQESNAFSLTAAPQPVGFGVEYKNQGGSNIKPELSHDKYYFDTNEIPETNLIPNTGNNPLFRHQETQEGIHCYQLYSVNWFSRTAGLSASVCTDETIFPVRNTMAPPANVSVQLVQTEYPPLLTTPLEQQAYLALTGDKTYLRTMFDWNYIQNQAYQYADKAQFFFNKQEKRITKGEILSIVPLSGHRLELTTTSYAITSGISPETVIPTIPDAIVSRFEDSLIAIDGLNYRVESIETTNATTGEYPKIIIHQIKETNSVETVTGSNAWTTTEAYVSPVVGGRFFISENLTTGANWDNKLQKSVFLETFSTNDTLDISGSTHNDGTYSIESVVFNATNTLIEVSESINDSVNDGAINVQLRFPSAGFTTGNDGYLIEGNVTSYFAMTGDVKIKGAIENDGDYTSGTISFNGTHTVVPINQTLDLGSSVAYLYLNVALNVVDYDTAAKTIAVAGDYTQLIIPTYKEIRVNSDGSETTLIMGGIFESCTIVEELDVYSAEDDANGYGTVGSDIANSRTGIYTITFNGNPLPPHIDPEVAWFRGKVRVMEDDSSNFLPTPLDPRTTARMKELDVSNVSEDTGGNLVLIATDATFEISRNLSLGTAFDPQGEYVPIVTGNVQANYHPSYLLYLLADEPNDFEEQFILPGIDPITLLGTLNEGSRQTFLGLRALDTEKNDPLTDNLASRMSVPAAINAMEIRDPEQPAEPVGPLYATRPDFYGKSTYTMDIAFPEVVEEPYSVLVYKANARKVLDQLYLPLTVKDIEDELELLFSSPEFYEQWNGFVNVDTIDAGFQNEFEFKQYGSGTFRFPIPDNDQYTISLSETTVNPVQPFDGSTAPGSSSLVFGNMTMAMAVKEAIETAFVSQTREPMIFQHLQTELETDGQTSSAPPKLRNNNGDRLKPTHADYNAHPNAIQMTNGELRFTDYNIDGGAVDFYFYYAMELSDRQLKSEASPILGPIQVINTRPAKKPSIKKVMTKIENPALGIQAAVCFQIEDYVRSENITRIDIYRALDPLDAMTIRSMEKAASIDVSAGIATTEICDMFELLDFPLYGEELHYRLVALREVTLEDNTLTEFIPSEASEMVKASLADPINPAAPCITSENGTTTATELQNVILKWDQVCYNGTYRLQKMNSSGNWVEVYTIKSNDDVMQYPPLDSGSIPDFTNFDATAILPREDASGTSIYHRFRVQVENSSGLFNLSDCPRVLATGDFDLQVLSSYLSYEDDYGFVLSELSSQQVDDGTNNNPTSMTFTANIPSPLPAGHNYFVALEITVTDDQTNTFTKTITTSTGSVQFNDGEGGLLLDEANHTYTITTKLTTDLATNGFRTKATLSYVHSPCNDLSNIAQILTVTDTTHTYDLVNSNVSVNDSSNDTPVTLQFTDVSDVANLTIPQTFTSLDITITDDFGNSETKQITTSGGSVTFDNTGSLIIDDGDQNRGFNVLSTLITSECATGQEFSYNIQYTYDPYSELQELADIIGFADANSAAISPLSSQSVNNDVNNPGGTITITDLLGANLPTNHTFDEVVITLYDGNGGQHLQTIASAGGNVIFTTGQGQTGSELDLGATNPNPSISIEVLVKTDLCPNGALFYYSLNYNYDPYVYLKAQNTIANFTDGNSFSVSPLYALDVNGKPLVFNDSPGGGVPGTFTNPNGFIKITDASASSLPAGDSFVSMEVILSDGIGGEHTLTITTSGSLVQFNHGDGGLELNGGAAIVNGVNDPTGGENRTYTIVLKLTTTLCPDGVTFVYSGRYTAGL